MRYFFVTVKYHKDCPCENVFLEVLGDLPDLMTIRSRIASKLYAPDVIIYMWNELNKSDFDMLSEGTTIINT